MGSRFPRTCPPNAETRLQFSARLAQHTACWSELRVLDAQQKELMRKLVALMESRPLSPEVPRLKDEIQKCGHIVPFLYQRFQQHECVCVR